MSKVVPAEKSVALLVNPASPVTEPLVSGRSQVGGFRALSLELHVLNAGTDQELDSATASARRLGGGLVIAPDAFFNSRLERLGALLLRDQVPAIYSRREFPAAGGLMSYGGGFVEAYRLAGVYAGRILKGEKPSDLPVQQATKVELVINLKTAKAFGLTVPPSLLATADEVIE